MTHFPRLAARASTRAFILAAFCCCALLPPPPPADDEAAPARDDEATDARELPAELGAVALMLVLARALAPSPAPAPAPLPRAEARLATRSFIRDDGRSREGGVNERPLAAVSELEAAPAAARSCAAGVVEPTEPRRGAALLMDSLLCTCAIGNESDDWQPEIRACAGGLGWAGLGGGADVPASP